MKKTCVLAGTFDPITKGHEALIKKALKTYDKIIVVIGVNDQKTCLFSLEDRLEFIKSAFNKNKRVSVEYHDGLMVDFLKERNLTEYIRGVRNEQDNEYEQKMLAFNKGAYPEINTIFYPANKKLSHVSSSDVKKMFFMGKKVKKYLPKKARKQILTAFSKLKKDNND